MRPPTLLLTVAAVIATGYGVPASATAQPTAQPASHSTVEQAPRGDNSLRTPGSLTGYAFDSCVSPSNAVMDRWWHTSPFSAVGIYLSGKGRACPQRAQPHLSPAWVRRQHDVGWRILPIHVGLQAPCFQAGDPTPTKPRMSAERRKAHRQGVRAAGVALDAADRYRIGRGSTVYLDIEFYDRARTKCNRAVLAHIDGWTERLHRARFRAGLYSSASAAVRALDAARHADPRRYAWPDQLWAGCSVCRPVGDLTPFLRDTYWRGHSRLHQYVLDTRATYGNVSYSIDKNWVDVGAGSVPHPQTKTCGGRLSWPSYPRLSRGDEGPRVATARCLLAHQDFFHAARGDTFTRGVERAVKRLQQARGLRTSGVLTRRSWVSLHAAGDRPVVKFGSDRRAVWRLQRALVAAGLRSPINGVVADRTTAAIMRWQHRVGRAPTGVVGPEQWRLLRRGKIGTS